MERLVASTRYLSTVLRSEQRRFLNQIVSRILSQVPGSEV